MKCYRCGKELKPVKGQYVYSRFTKRYYCPVGAACDRRAKRRGRKGEAA